MTRYRPFTGIGSGRCVGKADDEDGTEAFAGCFGFFASLLLRCWPFAMGISSKIVYERPRSLIASTTMPLPIEIMRMSDATRT